MERRASIKRLMTHNVLKNALVACCFFATLIYALYCYTLSHSLVALKFASVIITLGIILYISINCLYNRGILSIDKAFMIILVFLGITFCIVFTPGNVPDEIFHYLASYRYSNAILLQAPDVQGITMRAEDLALLETHLAHPLDYQSFHSFSDTSFFASDTSLVFFNSSQGSDFGMNPPQLKLASAIGITLGRLLGFGAYPVFYLGRIFNFCFFAVLVYFALRALPFGKNIMRVVALLPMTLHLAMSYSYDSGIIGLAFLLIAFCIKAIYDKGAINKKTCIAIGVLIFLLAPCKVVYFAIALLIFFIPNKRFSSRRAALLFKIGILCLGLVAILALRAPSLLNLANHSTDDSIFDRGDQKGQLYSLSSIIENPFAFIAILIRTSFSSGDFYLSSLIGGNLGWLQSEIAAPSYLVFLFLILLVLSALPTPDDESTAKLSLRFVFLVIAGIGYSLILLTMYLDWTFNTSPVIEGVQGRYFLPFLPLILMAIRGKTFVATRNLSWALIFASFILNSMYMMQVFSIALTL